MADDNATTQDWKGDLGAFFTKTRKATEARKRPEFVRFIEEVVMPAFAVIREEMTRHGRTVTVRQTEASASVLIALNGVEEMMYRIQARTLPDRVLPYAEIRARERRGLKYVATEQMFRSGAPDYHLADVTRDEVIRSVVTNYTARVHPA